MNIYAEVLPRWLGRVMYRINTELRRSAPPGTRFVSNPEEADFQILDVIGTGSMAFVRCERVILFVQGFLPPSGADRDFWRRWFERALLVQSFSDVPSLLGGGVSMNFLHQPWGVDGTVFYPRPGERTACIMTSGMDVALEAILECREAARIINSPMVHLGPPLPGLDEPGIVCLNGVSDDELAHWYSQCWRVSGLRRGDGFELPALEGLVCGSRPIAFDTPTYRKWYDGFAEFVSELPPDPLKEALADLMSKKPAPVTPEERTRAVNAFDWSVIMSRFWAAVRKALG